MMIGAADMDLIKLCILIISISNHFPWLDMDLGVAACELTAKV